MIYHIKTLYPVWNAQRHMQVVDEVYGYGSPESEEAYEMMCRAYDRHHEAEMMRELVVEEDY